MQNFVPALSQMHRTERGAAIREYLDDVFAGNSYAVAQAFNVGTPTAYKWIKGVSLPVGENLRELERMMEGSRSGLALNI